MWQDIEAIYIILERSYSAALYRQMHELTRSAQTNHVSKTCFRVVTSSNLGIDFYYPEFSLRFSQFLEANAGIASQIMRLPFHFYPLCNLTFASIGRHILELFLASLNK
jgi:hypothetical protein